jgi:sugar transferase
VSGCCGQLCWQDAPIGHRHPSPPTPTGLMWSILGTSCGFWCLVRRRRATPTRLTPPAIRQDSRVQSSFKQKRYAFNNELIEVLKLRSPYVDQCDAMASRLVTKRDPHVTNVGRVLRRASLGELPQLINVVFKGDLSLVGPTPPRRLSRGSPLRRTIPPQDLVPPLDDKNLPFPPVTNLEDLPLRTQRHVPNSIATIRRRLIVALAIGLPRCPCRAVPNTGRSQPRLL